MEKDHRLEITSLRQAFATCSCGHWHFIRLPDDGVEDLFNQFELHVKREEAIAAELNQLHADAVSKIVRNAANCGTREAFDSIDFTDLVKKMG